MTGTEHQQPPERVGGPDGPHGEVVPVPDPDYSYANEPVTFTGDINTETWMDETIQKALRMGASDLLMRTTKSARELRADIRIDGKMRFLTQIEGPPAATVIGRFKAGSNLSSAGSYRPEETVHMIDVGGELRKGRVALFRVADGGNSIVIRLPPTGPLRRLDDLQFSDHNLKLFKDLLKAANRMVLIAGPMGSGKTTTAHGALVEVADSTRTVWTIEDPVERTIDGLIQLEVDEENGAGFEALLPALVRSDYDTLFLGEIRDLATAAAGVRQAKAGRQVLTTIHANDNVTALLRLIELAQDSPLSVLDSVRGVVSQRLVAKLNPSWDGRNPLDKYKGRVPVHEVLTISEDLIEAVMQSRPLGEIREIAARHSKSTFMGDAQRLLNAGVTDETEIARALGELPDTVKQASRPGHGGDSVFRTPGGASPRQRPGGPRPLPPGPPPAGPPAGVRIPGPPAGRPATPGAPPGHGPAGQTGPHPGAGDDPAVRGGGDDATAGAGAGASED